MDVEDGCMSLGIKILYAMRKTIFFILVDYNSQEYVNTRLNFKLVSLFENIRKHRVIIALSLLNTYTPV